MAHRINIFHNLFKHPFIYDTLQTLTLSYSFRKRIVKQHFVKKNAKILDIGCATANVLSYLDENTEYYGFDTNDKCINHAKKKYKNQNFFCELFSEKNFEKLPNFDYVLLSAVAHHLSDEELITLLKLVSKKINDNSKVLIMDPFYSDKNLSLRNFFAYIDRGKNVRKFDEYLHFFKKEFKIIDAYESYPFLPPHNWIISVLSKA